MKCGPRKEGSLAGREKNYINKYSIFAPLCDQGEYGPYIYLQYRWQIPRVYVACEWRPVAQSRLADPLGGIQP